MKLILLAVMLVAVIGLMATGADAQFRGLGRILGKIPGLSPKLQDAVKKALGGAGKGAPKAAAAKP